MVVWLWGELGTADLTAIAVLVEGASQALHGEAVRAILSWNDQLLAGTTLGSVFPVVILEAIHFPNLSLSESLLSNWLAARRTDKARWVVSSFQCTDNMVFDNFTTCPAKFQTGLVTVLTEWYSCLIVVQFTSQRDMALSALEATGVVCPVQSLYGSFTQSHRLTAEATHLLALHHL